MREHRQRKQQRAKNTQITWKMSKFVKLGFSVDEHGRLELKRSLFEPRSHREKAVHLKRSSNPDGPADGPNKYLPEKPFADISNRPTQARKRFKHGLIVHGKSAVEQATGIVKQERLDGDLVENRRANRYLNDDSRQSLGVSGRKLFAGATERPHIMHSAMLARSLGLQADSREHVRICYPSLDIEDFPIRKFPNDLNYDPVEELLSVVDVLESVYLRNQSHQSSWLDQHGEYANDIWRCIKRKQLSQLQSLLENLSSECEVVAKCGLLERNLNHIEQVPVALLKLLLSQVYVRTVSAHVDALNQYQAFSSYTYGEILPQFMSKIIGDTGLKHEQCFVDLGSGIGNCVLQAAIEAGCESWGCEIMRAPADLAQKQANEAIERCKLFCLYIGDIHLVNDDFLANGDIATVLRRADVVLLNNLLFDAQLQAKILDLFLDLKDGCQVVALKEFERPEQSVSRRNCNAIQSIFKVEERSYASGSVSWSSESGKYFIHTIDRSRIGPLAEVH